MGRTLTDVEDAAWFWRVIGGGDGPFEQRLAAIRARLEDEPDEGVADFQALLRQAMAAIDSDRLVAAAYLLAGYVSDDLYEDAAAWVVSLGRSVWESVCESPDRLAEIPVVLDHPDDTVTLVNTEIGPAEELHLLAEEIWSERTGETSPEEWMDLPGLEAVPDWDDFDWFGKLPHLCRLFPASVAGLDRLPRS